MLVQLWRGYASLLLCTLLAMLLVLPERGFASDNDSDSATVSVDVPHLLLAIMLTSDSPEGGQYPSDYHPLGVVPLGTISVTDFLRTYTDWNLIGWAQCWGNHSYYVNAWCEEDVFGGLGNDGITLRLRVDNSLPDSGIVITETPTDTNWGGGPGHSQARLKWKLEGLDFSVPPGTYSEIVWLGMAEDPGDE